MAHVLVVDGDHNVRWLCRAILERAGHTVTEAADGDTAIGGADERQPDLILADVFLPGREGLDVIHDLRRAYPEAPVIVMTAGDWDRSFDELPDVVRLGVRAVLQKPFMPQHL